MKYKIIYHVGNELTIKTKADSGYLVFNESSIFISGTSTLEVPYTSMIKIEMFRLHGLGRMIKLVCADCTIFFAVIRLNIFGYFVFIDFLKTGRLYEAINDAMQQAKQA